MKIFLYSILYILDSFQLHKKTPRGKAASFRKYSDDQGKCNRDNRRKRKRDN